MHSDCLKMSNTFSLHFTFPLRFFINHDVIASQSLNLKKYLQLNIFFKLYFNTLNMNKQILHCRPRNFTTFTKQNLSRCLSLKFLSAEMDKYILHIPSCQRPCLSLTEIGSLDYWPPSKEIDFIFLKADFLPVVYFGNHHTQWGQKNYEVEVS